jgi:NADH:ubiquinone oxidoreductase subunit E
VLDEFMRQWMQRQCLEQVLVTPSSCVGPCGNGPNVLVYPEGILVTLGHRREVYRH